MLAEDRKRAGWSVEQAARRLGVSQAVYRQLEAGTRTPAP
jgi:transcriptional regulator with XRE-family HTH domain